MGDKPITLAKLKSHIKRRIKADRRLGLLGFLENRELTTEVESLFTFYQNGIPCGYDWVNGNDKLKELIKTL